MYSREPRKSTNSASDASHQNQFASKPFIIPQPRFDTEQPESEQTPDSQTEQGQAKPQGTWTNASMFTHRPVPKPPKIQLKPKINQPGDKYEQEADQVAEKVVQKIHTPQTPPAETSNNTLKIRRQPLAANGEQVQNQPVKVEALVQQNQSPPTIQRRLPEQNELSKLTREDAPNREQHLEGLENLLKHQMRMLIELIRQEKRKPINEREQENDMDILDKVEALVPDLIKKYTNLHEISTSKDPDALMALSEAIIKVYPKAKLGDPHLLNTPPTDDIEKENLQTLVNNANAIFAQIRKKDIQEVFGEAKVSEALTKFENGRIAMKELHQKDKILTDLSGHYEEVGIAGATIYQEFIFIPPKIINSPNDHESIATMIHESMHAGNSDVGDLGYMEDPTFRKLPEDVKIANAAHYEVIAWRILQGESSPWNGVFKPAGSGEEGEEEPALTPIEELLREVSETLRKAMTISLQIHQEFVDAYKYPEDWTVIDSGVSYKDFLPYWSKVENLTVHKKTDIDEDSNNSVVRDPAKQPVSLIDIALSEAFGHNLRYLLGHVPTTEDDLNEIVALGLSSQDLKQFKTSQELAEKSLLLIKAMLMEVMGLNQKPKRGIKAIEILSQTSPQDVYKPRDPNSFPD